MTMLESQEKGVVEFEAVREEIVWDRLTSLTKQNAPVDQLHGRTVPSPLQVSALPSPSSPSTVIAVENTVAQPPPIAALGLRRIPSQIRLAILSLKREQSSWEDMEDDLYILLDGKIECFETFRDLFLEMNSVIKQQSSSLLLRSLGYLCSTKANDMAVHDEHVSRVACFLSKGRDLHSLKLATLKTLVTCLTPRDALWQIQEDAVQGTYEFLTTPELEWKFMDNDHSAMSLIYELRAKCLREIEMERDRIRRVADKGNNAAVVISVGAKLVELGIQRSNKVIEGHIDNAGTRVKGWVEADRGPLIVDRDAVVAMAFSDTAKRASQYAREGSKAAASNLCDATISGMNMVGNKLGDRSFVEKLSPESREILKAAGKIGIATVGATAIVSEALIETSRGIFSKTANVTADVVGHKYGVTAGELAKNAADTAENLFRALSNAALMDGNNLAKTVAKNVGRDQIDKDIEKAKETIQLLEKHASTLATKTFGIQWQGSWVEELCKSTVEEASERLQDDASEIRGEKRDNPEPGSEVLALVKLEGSPMIKGGLSPRCQKSTVTKLNVSEDHSESDTSSLSISVSTEPTAYRIARRGKRSQRKRIPLRPDLDPIPSSNSYPSRHYTSSSLRQQGLTTKHLAPRRSWA